MAYLNEDGSRYLSKKIIEKVRIVERADYEKAVLNGTLRPNNLYGIPFEQGMEPKLSGDILMYNNGQLMTMPMDDALAQPYDAENYRPIGIVVLDTNVIKRGNLYDNQSSALVVGLDILQNSADEYTNDGEDDGGESGSAPRGLTKSGNRGITITTKRKGLPWKLDGSTTGTSWYIYNTPSPKGGDTPTRGNGWYEFNNPFRNGYQEFEQYGMPVTGWGEKYTAGLDVPRFDIWGGKGGSPSYEIPTIDLDDPLAQYNLGNKQTVPLPLASEAMLGFRSFGSIKCSYWSGLTEWDAGGHDPQFVDMMTPQYLNAHETPLDPSTTKPDLHMHMIYPGYDMHSYYCMRADDVEYVPDATHTLSAYIPIDSFTVLDAMTYRMFNGKDGGDVIALSDNTNLQQYFASSDITQGGGANPALPMTYYPCPVRAPESNQQLASSIYGWALRFAGDYCDYDSWKATGNIGGGGSSRPADRGLRSGTRTVVDENWHTDYHVFFAPAPHTWLGGYRDNSTGNTETDTTLRAHQGEWNVLQDFDGYRNSYEMWEAATQTAWQTSPDAINIFKECVPPLLCWLYSTPGTNQGDWYLPAAGELGFIIAYQGFIDEVIDHINQWAGQPIATPINPLPYLDELLSSGQFLPEGVDTNPYVSGSILSFMGHGHGMFGMAKTFNEVGYWSSSRMRNLRYYIGLWNEGNDEAPEGPFTPQLYAGYMPWMITLSGHTYPAGHYGVAGDAAVFTGAHNGVRQAMVRPVMRVTESISTYVPQEPAEASSNLAAASYFDQLLDNMDNGGGLQPGLPDPGGGIMK